MEETRAREREREKIKHLNVILKIYWISFSLSDFNVYFTFFYFQHSTWSYIWIFILLFFTCYSLFSASLIHIFRYSPPFFVNFFVSFFLFSHSPHITLITLYPFQALVSLRSFQNIFKYHNKVLWKPQLSDCTEFRFVLKSFLFYVYIYLHMSMYIFHSFFLF